MNMYISGEMLLWTSSVVTAFVTAVATGTVATAGGWLVLSVLGAVGINFVLLQASTGLEKKQVFTHTRARADTHTHIHVCVHTQTHTHTYR